MGSVFHFTTLVRNDKGKRELERVALGVVNQKRLFYITFPTV